MSSHWTLLDDLSATRRVDVERAIARLIEAHPGATLDHDPRWLSLRGKAADRDVLLYVLLGGDGELHGYAPFFVHPSSFSMEYAARTFWKVGTRRHTITAHPLFERGVDEAGAITNLLVTMRGRARARDVLFGLGVPMSSVFGQVLSQGGLRRHFFLMPHGPEYSRRLIKLPDSLEAYLALLGSKTRQDLRRQERKLLKEAGNDVRVTAYADCESVVEFVRAAAEVSQRTYQWRMHKLGIVADAATIRRFSEIAAQGMLRCYILYVRDTPAAFMVGYLYRGVYYSETIGYDPEWGDFSVGNVLHLHVVGDLTGLQSRPVWFDFLYGDNPNKERLSTDAHREGNFYLVPRTLRWSAVIWSLRAFDAATNALNGVLERHGVKSKIQRWLRRRSSKVTVSPGAGADVR